MDKITKSTRREAMFFSLFVNFLSQLSPIIVQINGQFWPFHYIMLNSYKSVVKNVCVVMKDMIV